MWWSGSPFKYNWRDCKILCMNGFNLINWVSNFTAFKCRLPQRCCKVDREWEDWGENECCLLQAVGLPFGSTLDWSICLSLRHNLIISKRHFMPLLVRFSFFTIWRSFTYHFGAFNLLSRHCVIGFPAITRWRHEERDFVPVSARVLRQRFFMRR